MEQKSQEKKIRWPGFLRDVLICSLGAYGGPEAHISVLTDQMVVKKKYLTEAELIELFALCSILPGPTSTQTIVSIGYKQGGAVLALLTMLVWGMPVITVMTALSFMYQILAFGNISHEALRYIGPMAVGVSSIAAFRISRKVVKDVMTGAVMAAAALTTYLIRSPWVFPAVLAAAGALSIIVSKEKNIWNTVKLSPPWRYLAAFAFFAVGGIVLGIFTGSRIVQIFESFYRYGYLVFGGGQVVVPVMHSELVHVRNYMTDSEFLTGYGLVQGLPGPMFSFAAYAGGLASRGGSVVMQAAGALTAGISIFLPGLLLIYFVYPVWEKLKQIRAVKISLKGINAAAGGMIAAAAVILIQASGFQADFLAVTAVSALLLATRKIPAPLIVAAALAGGFLI